MKKILLPMLGLAYGLGLQAFAGTYSVSVSNPLDSIGAKIQRSPDRVNTVNFTTFAKVGHFSLDGSCDSLIFQKVGESDSAIELTDNTPLFTIKKMKGVVLFRNLGVHMTASAPVVISGSDAVLTNGSLLIDSCFFVADTMNSKFLAWVGGATDSVSIRRSFMVSTTGKGTLSLEAGKLSLLNNAFNFAGLINTSTYQSLNLQYNTFTRTQFKGDGNGTTGYVIAYNLFTYHSAYSAFGPGQFYPVYMSLFNETLPNVQGNVLYNDWSSFEASATRFPANKNFNKSPPFPRDTTELWNWYDGDPVAGFDHGADKLAVPYNVFPKERVYPRESSSPMTLGGKTGRFYFKPSWIPRKADPKFSGPALGKRDDDLRFVWPGLPGLRMADSNAIAFELDSLVLDATVNDYNALPILLSYNQGLWNRPLTATAGNTRRFTNKVAGARSFHPAYLCTTLRGESRVPKNTDSTDVMVFGRVDSAGTTTYANFGTRAFADDNRYLGTNFGFSTTAKLGAGTKADTMAFGTVPSPITGLAAYRADSIFWWMPAHPDTLLPMRRVGQAYVSTYKADDSLEAYLIEHLSARRGTTHFSVPDGRVTVISDSGFQISVDSISNPKDVIAYDSPTIGVKFAWIGRGDSDKVELRFRRSAGQSAFAKDSTGTHPVTVTEEADGIVKIDIKKGDAGKVFFLGTPFNVIANDTLAADLDGVKVSGFVSSTSGRLDFRTLNADVLKDFAAFKDTRFLGGDSLETIKLNVTSNWSLTLPIRSSVNPQKLEVYLWDGTAWSAPFGSFTSMDDSTVRVDNLPANTRRVLVVERVEPAITYIDTKESVTANHELVLHADYKPNSINKHIVKFKVEMEQVDSSGHVTETVSDTVTIGSTVTLKPHPNRLVNYRWIFYLEDSTQYSNESPIPVPSFSWDANLVSKAIYPPVRVQDQWSLIGFPVKSALGSVLKPQPSTRDTVKDSTVYLGLKTVANILRYDTLKYSANDTVGIGDAFLLGSTLNHKVVADSAMEFYEPKVFSRSPKDTGWNFFACPFPMIFSTGKVRSNLGLDDIWTLTVKPGVDSSHRIYGWEPAVVLNPFQGYAYPFRKGEVLTFDPFAGDITQGSQKVGAPGPLSSSSTLVAGIAAPWGESKSWLTNAQGKTSLAFLSAPGGGLEMRLGGDGGYLRKRIKDASAIDEPVEFHSTMAGAGKFALRTSSGASAAFQEICLIDADGGRIFQGAELQSLPLIKGTNSYRLLAGDKAFVEARTRSILSGLPTEMSLSQNFPNPVHRFTRIQLDWPAFAGAPRSAVLAVFDMRGRQVESIDLGRVSMGRQLLQIDAGSWAPGIYTYRLTVNSGSHVQRLQRRMLVAQ